MNPAKPVRAESALQQQVRDWLQYGEELGLAPYYRDRPTTFEAVGVLDSSPSLSSGQERLLAPGTEFAGATKLDAPQFAANQTPMPPKSLLKSAAASLLSPAHAKS